MRAVAWAMRRAGLRNVQELQIVFQSHEITTESQVLGSLLFARSLIAIPDAIGTDDHGEGHPRECEIEQCRAEPDDAARQRM